jgi:hypothetical protein
MQAMFCSKRDEEQCIQSIVRQKLDFYLSLQNSLKVMNQWFFAVLKAVKKIQKKKRWLCVNSKPAHRLPSSLLAKRKRKRLLWQIIIDDEK